MGLYSGGLIIRRILCLSTLGNGGFLTALLCDYPAEGWTREKPLGKQTQIYRSGWTVMLFIQLHSNQSKRTSPTVVTCNGT